MRLSIATYNVKDLLEHLYPGAARLDAKLGRLAREIDCAEPDVLALQEVGSEALVRALVARTKRARAPFDVAMGAVDSRGIGCAIVSFAPLSASQTHTAEQLPFPVFDVSDPPPFAGRLPLRRGVVHVQIAQAVGGPIHVLVAHFKSKHVVPLRPAPALDRRAASSFEEGEGVVRSLVWRLGEALFVRRLVDAILAGDPAARVVVAGDLNDLPASVPLEVVRGVGAGALVGCEEVVPADLRYSVIDRGVPQQIDHLLVSQNLRRKLVSARFFTADLRDHGPFDPTAGVVTVDSDHALFCAEFDLDKA